MMQRKKRKIPAVNSSSSADIAFLLLIFFLVTTSMGAEKGILRRLAPADNHAAETEQIRIKQRNIWVLYLDANNQITANGKAISLKQVKEKAIEFIANSANSAALPEKITLQIPLLGNVPVTQFHTISLQTHPDAQYGTYVAMQNALSAAYNALRDNFALQHFAKSFASLSSEQQEAVRTVYPQRIAEVETHTQGGVQP